jgi:hypothetical protein
MSKRSQKPVKAAASVPTGYGPLLAELKSRVRAAQVRAALSVNRELIALYWDIGRVILQRQQAEGWGAKVVARLAADLRAEFPEIKEFSARNLDYYVGFRPGVGRRRNFATACCKIGGRERHVARRVIHRQRFSHMRGKICPAKCLTACYTIARR